MKKTEQELVNEVLDLSILVLREFFRQLKENNPIYFETIKPLVFGKSRSIPSFLEKRYTRTKSKYNNQKFLEEVVRQTGLKISQIKALNNKGIGMSYILDKYSKNKSTQKN